MKTINKRILSAFMVGIMIVQLVFPVFQSSVYAQEILENESNSLTSENQEATSNLSDSLEELGATLKMKLKSHRRMKFSQ